MSGLLLSVSMLNLDLCLLFCYNNELQVLHADGITCMFMNHNRT